MVCLNHHTKIKYFFTQKVGYFTSVKMLTFVCSFFVCIYFSVVANQVGIFVCADFDWHTFF